MSMLDFESRRRLCRFVKVRARKPDKSVQRADRSAETSLWTWKECVDYLQWMARLGSETKTRCGCHIRIFQHRNVCICSAARPLRAALLFKLPESMQLYFRLQANRIGLIRWIVALRVITLKILRCLSSLQVVNIKLANPTIFSSNYHSRIAKQS